MGETNASGSESLQWLDENMVEALEAPDEAFDAVYMLRDGDWPLLASLFRVRPPAWRGACMYVFCDGPVDEGWQLLLMGLDDVDVSVREEAAGSLCHMILTRPAVQPRVTRDVLTRLTSVRNASPEAYLEEVDVVLRQFEC